jgi:hypothetical protein
MPERARCQHCGHAAHRKACRAKGPSGCVPLADADGRQVGIACGPRPPCPCPYQVCKCGLPVAVAHLAGTDLDAAMERGSAGAPDGRLAVRKNRHMLDGSLVCRELGDGEPLRAGEWRGREHVEWPDHGPVAAKYANEPTVQEAR